ncbi:hypothetical protein [Flavobacterium sp. W22_SRS_FK3]|uniref:hypothetical protein n=1 Tax=Flavobacterium sp. W22_SRS_FK3 TaxID=3240275 RepID=UPI003F8EAABE
MIFKALSIKKPCKMVSKGNIEKNSNFFKKFTIFFYDFVEKHIVTSCDLESEVLENGDLEPYGNIDLSNVDRKKHLKK